LLRGLPSKQHIGRVGGGFGRCVNLSSKRAKIESQKNRRVNKMTEQTRFFAKLGSDAPWGWYIRASVGNDSESLSFTGPFKSRRTARDNATERKNSVPGVVIAIVNHSAKPHAADREQPMLPPFTAMPKLDHEDGLIKAWEAASTAQRQRLLDWVVSRR
jgi:hypothetical protein